MTGGVTLAIVLRTTDYREADRMLTLFTREHGRIDALARGCRSQKSKLRACTEAMVCAEYTFFEKNDRYYISGASLRKSFFNIREDIAAYYAACAMTEACERCVQPGLAEPGLFSLLAHCLFALDNVAQPEAVFCFFAVRMLDTLGVRPSFERCVRCGGSDIRALAPAENGVLCAGCHGGEPLPEQSREYFIAVQRLSLKSCGELTPPHGASGQAARMMLGALGSKLRSLDVLMSLFDAE